MLRGRVRAFFGGGGGKTLSFEEKRNAGLSKKVKNLEERCSRGGMCDDVSSF